jgi:16S rRNA (guanine1207-N2)-methyltransferase
MEKLLPLASERLLIERLPNLPGKSALVVSSGRAQLADELALRRGYVQVTAWYLDLYTAAVTAQEIDPSVNVACSADLPDEELDFAAIPVMKRSESELTRDLMQQAHQRLKIGGYLAMAVDHAADRWVHEQMQAIFAKVSCDRSEAGCVYWAKKIEPLKKVKNFDAEFAFRDNGRLIKAISRPGVFAHRRMDGGARQLIESAEIGAADHVLDMGCGVGTVSLAAAFKTTGLVHSVDSNARALDCVTKSAALNGLANIQTHLNADGQLDLPQLVDVALANPPYYGDDTIAQHFVEVCIRYLNPGGALLAVTKNPRWYHAYFENRLEDIAIFEAANYFVCCGRKPA